MKIDLKMSKDFETTLDELKNKYGEDFEYLNGFHSSQLNFSDFIDGFIDNNIADVTIDANANSKYKDICSMCGEKGKSEDKLFAFNKIFFEIKKKYGLKTAKKWLETEYTGGFYLHDAPSSSYKPYCYAYDLTRLAKEGLFFLNDYNNQPPKHLTTFLDDVIEFVSFMSNRSSGACGIPNVLLWTFYFWKKDVEDGYFIKDPEYYVKQNFQKFIYRLNQPFLRVNQSAFVNVSIFDRPYLESLFGGVEFPDGTFAIDYINDILEHEKKFMEVVSEVRRETLFTFPVLTYSLLKRTDITEDELKEMRRYRDWNIFADNEFARWCSDHNVDWNDSNFFMNDNVGVLSNCPLSGDTEVLYFLDNNCFKSTISDLYNKTRNYDKDRKISVISNGIPVPCKVNKFNKPVEYEIILTNGLSIKTTSDHLNKVYSKDYYVQTKDLTIYDYIPIDIMVCDNLNVENSEQFIDDGYLWVKIAEIIKGDYDSVSYCIEILNKVEPVFTLANGIVTHNCRLLSDTSKLDGFINSIGGTALSIGSVKVNTINLMRIAYEVNEQIDDTVNKNDNLFNIYLDLLKDRVELCCKTLDIIRHIIKRNIEKGLLPNYCDGGIEMSKQYCTVGILGLYEVIEFFGLINRDEFGNVSYTDDGIKFASEIFNVINEVKDNFTDEYSFNCESVPAERAAVILCQKDNLIYERNEKFIYSNQWIPLSEKCTIKEKLKLSSILDIMCSGGSIAHINLEKNFPNTDMAWDMLNEIAASGVIYFAFNTRINECENHHGFVGTDICPTCGGSVIDTYQRIVGFLEPVRSYSKDRKREYGTRQWYDYANMKGEL